MFFCSELGIKKMLFSLSWYKKNVFFGELG